MWRSLSWTWNCIRGHPIIACALVIFLVAVSVVIVLPSLNGDRPTPPAAGEASGKLKVRYKVSLGPTQPAGIAVSPDGSRIYTANGTNDTVSVVDAARYTVAATIPVPGYQGETALADSRHSDVGQ